MSSASSIGLSQVAALPRMGETDAPRPADYTDDAGGSKPRRRRRLTQRSANGADELHRLSQRMMEAAETPTDPLPRAEPAGATILVCDDEPSLRELVRAVLGPEYRFIEAADGRAALALAHDAAPDLVVLDLMLPVMSGIAVLEELRADERLAAVPVIVMTAWSHAESSAWTAGADRFVSKPFHPDELTAAVEELLS